MMSPLKLPLRQLLLFSAIAALCPGSASADVVINEIMYHASSDNAGDEFIELHNTAGIPVDLFNWCFDGGEEEQLSER